MALAQFYCCKLFMREMLNLETEVWGKLIPCYFYLSVLFSPLASVTGLQLEKEERWHFKI